MHRTALLAVLIATAVLAPVAKAERPDNRGGLIGVGSVTSSAMAPARPDDRAGVRGPGSLSASAAPTILVASDGFDWLDASIGAAGAIGIALAAAGLLTAARGHRRRGALTAMALATALVVPAGVATAAEPPGPSCNGVFSSSAAGDPRHVAEVAHFVKDLAEVLGIPPGAFNSTGAQTHCER